MKNKTLYVTVALTLIVAVTSISIFNRVRLDRTVRLTDAAITVATTLLSFYRGVDGTRQAENKHGNYVSPVAIQRLRAYHSELQSRHDRAINLDEVFSKQYGMTNAISDKVREPKFIDDLPKGSPVVAASEASLGYSPDIFLVDGQRHISVTKLDFDEDDKAYVLYNGMYLVLDRQDIPETYTMMLNNPKHNYRYDSHFSSGKDSFIDVAFRSVYDGSPIVVRVHTDGRMVTDFHIR